MVTYIFATEAGPGNSGIRVVVASNRQLVNGELDVILGMQAKQMPAPSG